VFSGPALAGYVQHYASMLAEMELFDPPAPLRDEDEAALAVGHWLRLADDVMRHDEGGDPAR